MEDRVFMKAIKQGTLAAIVSGLTLFATSVSAQSYLGFGAGLMFNLGQLGGTITNDGLKSTKEKPEYNTAGGVTGAGKGCFSPLNTGADGVANSGDETTSRQACLLARAGTEQDGIIPNRTLKDYDANVPLLESEIGGSMTGLVLNVFYELSLSNWSFLRVDISYNTRIMGGQSSSTFAGIEWYKDKWDYRALVVPAYFGIKAKVGETAAVYGGAGINYHRGGWSVTVTSIGDIPSIIGVPIGAVTSINSSGNVASGPILGEGAKFVTEGMGFNVLIGVEGGSGPNKVFFEMDTLIAGDTEAASVQGIGAQTHLARVANKPIVLAGTTYRFGYKIGM